MGMCDLIRRQSTGIPDCELRQTDRLAPMLPLLFPGIYCNLETGHDRKDFQNPGVSGRWTLILLLGAFGIAAGAGLETAIVIWIPGSGGAQAVAGVRPPPEPGPEPAWLVPKTCPSPPGAGTVT